MTVSRALRNDPSVLETTKTRVLKAAGELGYSPNPLLSAWMVRVAGGRKRKFEPVLYYVIRSPNATSASRAIGQRRHYAFAKARAEELGFRLEVMVVHTGLTFKRISEILWARRCPGVIIAPFHDAATDSIEMEWDHFSAITIGYSLVSPDLHRVSLNHFMGMEAVLDSLLKLRPWKIGYIVRHFSDARIRHLLVASYLSYRFHHPEAGLLEPLCLEELKENQFRSWFLEHQPEIIIASDKKILDWVEAFDKRPAKKRCRIVHPDSDYSADPRIFATMRAQSDLIGRASVDLLAAMIYNNERGLPAAPRIIMIPTELEILSTKGLS